MHLESDNGVSLKKVDKFCYLEDMLDASYRWRMWFSSKARVRSAWKNFREYLPIL